MDGIRQAGFTQCTPIQAQTLPIALAGRDVAGQAQTGTGKTAAFLVALYQALLTRPPSSHRSPTAIRALIVAPTRELAVQIHRDALTLGAHTGLKHNLVFGGIDYEKQRLELSQGCDVLIGTPGRLIDYFKQHVFDLRHAQVLVLDEADRMFDLGEKRLKEMDEAGIDVQVLSHGAPSAQKLSGDGAVALTRRVNDRLAAVVAAKPDRFAAFAALPTCDPKAAAESIQSEINQALV